ncbi:DNA cytosine methyltransferase [Nocardia stercoris]|uniref:DNA cytosine methyltransferase n=1 Tax=Nocardia stercoris TaxID=2483361 RepID=UPI001F44B0B2|nr:DNA (cytosine-5-)-methyltransferase [Nocardia stercoris]
MAGLFAGIGGLELGLGAHGWDGELLCEIDAGARGVLAAGFPDAELHPDVKRLRSLPAGIDVVAAGFPCQDLSQAGRTAGITGDRSGLVDEVFRLVRRRKGPRWLLMENVPFMLQLAQGHAMRHITTALEELGYAWAYRVVDARAFGLPQRRERVLMLASRTEDPRPVLFGTDAGPRHPGDAADHPCGFYWTEGVRGLGWAVNAVPTLKGGSGLGIASPPAVRLPSGEIVTPGITDAERLQGFDPDWTLAAVDVPGVRAGHRWKLVGNAVSVRMAEWIGSRLAAADSGRLTVSRSTGTALGHPAGTALGYHAAALRHPAAAALGRAIDPAYGPHIEVDPALWLTGEPMPGTKWPSAAWGRAGTVRQVPVSSWPVHAPYEDLRWFLDDARLLSARATAGFLRRAARGALRFPPGFLADVENHLHRMGGHPQEAA